VSGLALVRLAPDLDRLARAAAARGLIGRGGDFGYALHATLAAALGDIAPKPFLLRADMRRPEILGYTSADPTEFRELSRLPPIDDADLVEAPTPCRNRSAGAARRLGARAHTRFRDTSSSRVADSAGRADRPDERARRVPGSDRSR